MIDVNEFCDLLIVEVGSEIHVVEAPAYEANKGDFVSFTNGTLPMMGKIVDKMWCEKDKEVYRFVGYLGTIHQAERIYYPRWERENN